jgi:competence protein ComEC
MAGLAMTARLLGRQSHGLASLAAASLAMTGVEPHLLWDAGFQLSFASTLGLLLYGQPLQETLAKLLGRFLEKAVAKVILRPASEFFLLTLAAQLTSLPILALHFSRLPLLGLAANLLILPVQPALMILAGLALMAGTLWLPAGQGLAWLAWPAAAYTIRAVEWMASLDLQIHLGPRISAWWVPLYYALLAAATALPSRIRDKFSPLRISTAAATFLLAAMALANGFLWRSLADAPDGRLHLTLLPVKGGAALLVQAPSGRMALINGGKSSIDLSQALGRRMPLTRRSLDWWVELASSDDQIAALEETLPRYPPERALIHSQGEGASHRRVLKSLHTARIPTVPMEPGQTLDLGQGARLQILGLQPQGGYALLSYGRFRFLMAAGEVRPDQELDLTGLTAILLAEKGDLNANPPEWLAALNPALVLLAAGEGDPKSRPDPRLMEHLQGRTLLRTDQHGWIELITDGRQLWIRVERLPLPAEDFPSSARQKRWPPPINP